jgi:hypothetical protein
MKENLIVTHYNNGDPIIQDKDYSKKNVSFGSVGKYTYYNNDENTSKTYGKIYNWLVANDNRNVCPTGWHVPRPAEWSQLISYIGNDTITGMRIKEEVLVGLPYWSIDDRQPFGGDIHHRSAFCLTLKYEGCDEPTGISGKAADLPLKCIKDSIIKNITKR